MKKHVCSRCRAEESIPTHQLLKFDASGHELCGGCWKAFRAWFFAGDRIVRWAEPKTSENQSRGEAPAA